MNKGIRKSFSKIPINRREILRGKFLTLQHHGRYTHGAEKEDTSDKVLIKILLLCLTALHQMMLLLT